MSTQSFKSFGQVLYVVGVFDAFYQHVVNIDLHILAYLVSKDFVYQSLVGGSDVLQAERHHFVAVQASVCDERSMFLILGVHPDLIIA